MPSHYIPAPGSPAVRPDGRPIGETVMDYAGDLIRQAADAGKLILQRRVQDWVDDSTEGWQERGWEDSRTPTTGEPDKVVGETVPTGMAAAGIGGVAFLGLAAVALIAVMR